MFEENDELQPTEDLAEAPKADLLEDVEGAEKPAESAPAEQTKKKVEFTQEQQEVVNKRIGKSIAQQRQAERELAEVKERLARLETPALQPKALPELPDPLTVSDAEFKRLQAARDLVVVDNAKITAQNERQQAEAQSRQRELVQNELKTFQTKVTAFEAKASTYGVATDDLRDAAAIVDQFLPQQRNGLPNPLIELLVDDDDGPLMTKYLATNVEELNTLANMSPEKAVARLFTKVKPEAQKFKPKTSNAPEPLDLPSGGPAGGQKRKSTTYE
jgi:hypothetical protein